MAVPFYSAESPQPLPDVASNLVVLRPELDEFVFALEQKPLPTFEDIGVETATTLRRADLDTVNAKLFERYVRLSDGTKFPVFVALANNPVSHEPVAKVPAWWTSPSKGFNKKTTDSLNTHRRHTVTKGIATNKPLSLYRNSWDVHLALDDIAKEFGDQIDVQTVSLEGDSNGAMTGTGVLSYAEGFGHDVSDAYLVDPCIVTRLGVAEAIKLAKHPEYIVKELWSLGRQGLRLIKEEDNIRDYIDTIEFSPEFLAGNILLSRGLLWGELGHLMAHVPADQKAFYHFFDHSIGNQKKMAQRILAGSQNDGRPNITTLVTPGTHLSIANPRHLKAKVARLTSAS